MLKTRIKELREQHGMSQEDLASTLNIGQSTVAMWENGRNKPQYSTLIKLANLFNVSIDYIMYRDEQITTETPALRLHIKEARKAKGLSQAELAKMIGVNDNTICNYELGNRTPDIYTIERISKALDVPISFILGIEAPNIKSKLPNRLKILRTQKKLTQADFSELLGISRSAVAMWEIGAARPDNDMLVKISKILDTSVDYLLGLEPKKPIKKAMKIYASERTENIDIQNSATFAVTLRNLRTQKGVNQKDIAEYLNIDRTTYTKYESGTSEPNISAIKAIANYFNVSIDYLLGNNIATCEHKYEKINISSKLKNLRKYNGLTQEDVANYIGLSRAAYTNIENGKRLPSFKSLKLLAKLYNVTTDYLLS